jgi:hypothetical protein
MCLCIFYSTIRIYEIQVICDSTVSALFIRRLVSCAVNKFFVDSNSFHSLDCFKLEHLVFVELFSYSQSKHLLKRKHMKEIWISLEKCRKELVS